MSEPMVVGIDVAKETLEAAWDVQFRSFANSDAGHEALIAELRPNAVELIVIEASSGAETACACALQGVGFCVTVVNPRQARELARSIGYLANTDRVDAGVLQRFAALIARQPDRDKYIKVSPGAGHRSGAGVRRAQLSRCSPPADRSRHHARRRAQYCLFCRALVPARP